MSGTHNTFSSSGPAPNTDGPHKSDALNKVDPRVDSNRDHKPNPLNPHGTADTTRDAHDSVRNPTTTGGRGLTGSETGTTIGPNSGPVYSGNTTTTGSGLSGNHGTHGTHGSSGLPEGTTGPHSSRAANAADPRVDSDLDSTRRTGGAGGIGSSGGLTGSHGTHGSTGTSGLTGSHGTHGSSGLPEGTTGPHSSRAANAADPRVDSDLDSSRRTGGSTHTGGVGATGGLTGSHGTHGTHGTTGTSGLTGSHGTHGAHGTHGSSGLPEGTTGPHSSRAANAADPRVDSDLDSSRRTGGSTHTGGVGATGTSGHHTTGTTAGPGSVSTGPAPNTAGPHKSDFLNKADPRVDSNLDGSKTIGGNKTFDASNVDSTRTSH